MTREFNPNEHSVDDLRTYQFIGEFAELLMRFGMTCTGLDLARILCWNELVDGDYDDPKIASGGAAKTKPAWRMAFCAGNAARAHACYSRFVSKASREPLYEERHAGEE